MAMRVEEGATIANILTKLRQTISDEPLPAGLQKMDSQRPELHMVNSGAPAADIGRMTLSARSAARADEDSKPQSASASGILEMVFANAMREVIPTLVQQWVNSHQEELTSALGLIVQRWMDENLPGVVETGLKQELRRPNAPQGGAR